MEVWELLLTNASLLKPDPNQIHLFAQSGFILAPVWVRTHFTFFQTRSCFLAELGCNQLRDLEVSTSSAIPHLLCSLSIIYSHKEKPKENKKQNKKRKRERTQSKVSAVWDRHDKLTRWIFTSSPQGGERGTLCYNTVNYLSTDFLRNL